MDTLEEVMHEYDEWKAKNLSLNMARGKPSHEQEDLSRPMLDLLASDADLSASDGTNCANYGCLEGLPEARALMALMLDDDPANIIIGGGSSLNLMYDTLARLMLFGAEGGQPWSQLEQVKWLCPVPGYDRHFSVLQDFGIQMISLPLGSDGPVLDDVAELIASDSSIKGIWCVPQYSNPTGITYSDDMVRTLAALPCAADDFRIFWDNAYSVHHLYDEEERREHVLDIGQACREAGNPNRYIKFASTSKVTFPGAGISAIAASTDNIAWMRSHLQAQTIGFDKLNQLRHARFLPTAEALDAHMRKHAAIIAPKFRLVEEALAPLVEYGCTWSEPAGGYFICFTGQPHTAKRTVELAAEAGVVLTQAGATHPYGQDPDDATIRIAPTLPPADELQLAMQVFVCCAKIAYLEAY